MFGFQITKWFWNLWDHLLTIILLNLISLVLVGGSFYLFQFLVTSQITGNLAAVLLGITCFGYLFLATTLQHAYALANYSIAKFARSDWRDSLRRAWLKPSLWAALLLDVLLLLFGTIYYVSWRFYSQQNGILSLLALSLLFWLAVLFLLGFGFYFPMLVREEFSLKKAWRHSFVIFLDNPKLTIGLGLMALVFFAISLIPPLTLLLGLVGLGLWYEVSLRILYYKYEYIEQLQDKEQLPANERCKKVEIPWRVLLREERERIGPRSLRNFIFPWKD